MATSCGQSALESFDAKRRHRAGDAWRVGSVKEEARSFHKMVLLGSTTVTEVLGLISVNDKEMRELKDWTRTHPSLWLKVLTVLTHRAKVKKEFLRLVNEKVSA